MKNVRKLFVLLGLLVSCTPVIQETQPEPPSTLISILTPNESPSRAATPLPSPILTQSTASTSAPSDESVFLPSPNGQWMAILSREVASLEIKGAQGEKQVVFPAGSTVSEAKWSPDSRQLAVVLSHLPEESDQDQSIESPEIGIITLEGGAFREAELGSMVGEATSGLILLGAWSPDSHRLFFWSGPLSASLQADGLPLWVMDTKSMQTTGLSETTLVNLSYQSWAPGGSALVFTNGGYRSAQVGKWLSLYEVDSGRVTTLISEDELVPGQVAWSPTGEAIAFAAVEAGQTGGEWADWMGWDNPAIQVRRIYLLDLSGGNYRRLNTADTYQDAPRWSADGKTLYYVQMDTDQAVIMAVDPAIGEAQPLPGCQVPLPDRAGYYGQVDWTTLYENCPGILRSVAPTNSSPSILEQSHGIGQIEAINAIRTLFDVPALPLEFSELGSMLNSPTGRLSVAVYQDTEGRNYSVEPSNNQVVEIDARAALLFIPPDVHYLSQEELRARALELVQAAIPNFDSQQADLSYEEGVKEDYYFFTWRAADSSGLMNKPFAQIGLHKSGELFTYYNTLTLIEKGGASITGQVISGYSDHQPVANLPLRVRQKDDDGWDTYTDEDGYFNLTNLPIGRLDVENSHLSFWFTIDSPSQAIDLGKLRYPLIHPPDYYWWQAAPLADFTHLLDEGKPVSFEVCAADAGWMRPDHDTQLEQVYAQLPFSQLDEKSFEKYEHIALLYDTVDVTQQSFPGGLNLDELGADWLYLTGLWTASTNPFLYSSCSYAPEDLQSLFDRSLLEVWLLGSGLRGAGT